MHEPLYTCKPHGHDSEQRVFRFPNDFGASVVCHKYSYGGDQGRYEPGVDSLLEQIAALPRV